MGLFTLPYPLGLDSFVDGCQRGLFRRLLSTWSIDETKYNCFARAERNYIEDDNGKGYIPEFYNPASDGYVASSGTSVRGGIFFEQGLAAVSFFGLIDNEKSDKGKHTARLELLFFIDLSKITPGGIPLNKQMNQRLGDVALNDVRNYIQGNGNNFTVHDTSVGVDKVLERYSGWQKNDTLKRDMQPYYCFKIILEIRYNPLLNQYFPNYKNPST